MGVEVSRLSNGLTVATETLPSMESVALGAWVKSENPRELLRGWLDGKRRELEAGVTEASSELEAVESWTAGTEQRAGAPQPPAAAPPSAEPAPDDREPQADGSGAPIR